MSHDNALVSELVQVRLDLPTSSLELVPARATLAMRKHKLLVGLTPFAISHSLTRARRFAQGYGI